MIDFSIWALDIQRRTEHTLDQLLPQANIAPQRLHEAMRYSLLGGGKRVRALIAHASGALCHASVDKIDIAASAVEMIHAYSLVHDDMPCMDDDDLRRGKPSCHKQYDDATALLVGDALQTSAFQTLATAAKNLEFSPEQRLRMLSTLAIASGSRGMAGGQAIDLASVGKDLTQLELEYMHIHKTGALIRAAALLGAYCGDQENETKIAAINQYSEAIGLAFQVVDDILDSEADTATLGKTAGKDADSNKPTYVTILGLSRAKALANELYENALDALEPFGDEALRLRQLAQFIMQRSF
jgi:farnesyl diphosphate synthase